MAGKLHATLSSLLDAALALPPDARLAWVDGLAAEYAEFEPRLRALVERSLRADAHELLATLPKFDPASESAVMRFEASAHAVGAVVGPFQLVRCLGMGAMGVVWLAERRAAAEPRKVALKFAHVAERGSSLVQRLARERQLLAALDHPNIARLYDAAITNAGQPYLVLEYVAGSALQDYCSQQRPSHAQRLALFLEIARAVAHAHARQIVHRDLKPANIMVGHDGSAHLLDFGIGKLLVDGLAVELELSRFAGRPLTPAYAAPEQILGTDAALPADVYALGVILYELLTGARPYVYAQGSNRGLREAILTVVPEPASSRYVAPELGDALRSALDAIVHTALQKQPERRFASACELSSELERILFTGPALR